MPEFGAVDGMNVRRVPYSRSDAGQDAAEQDAGLASAIGGGRRRGTRAR